MDLLRPNHLLLSLRNFFPTFGLIGLLFFFSLECFALPRMIVVKTSNGCSIMADEPLDPTLMGSNDVFSILNIPGMANAWTV